MKKSFRLISLNGEKMKKVKGGTVTNPNQTSQVAQQINPAGCSGCDRAGSGTVCPSMGGW